MNDYNKLVELEPNNADHYVNRGVVYERQKNSGKTMEDYNKALSLNPKQYVTLNNIGAFYLGQGDFTQAIDYFNRALNIKSDYSNSYLGRSRAYCKLGKTALANADEKKAAEFGEKNILPCVADDAAISKPKPITKSDFELALQDLYIKNYAQAYAKAEKIFSSDTIDSKSRGSQVLQIAQKLYEAEQYNFARKLSEKSQSQPCKTNRQR